MSAKENIRKFHKKMMVESVLKSVLYGAVIGLVTGLLVTLILYLFKFDGVYISVIASVIVSAGAAVLLYKFIFMPTANKTASRMDAIGLEERVITMVEFEKSDTLIAEKQREETRKTLESITPKQMKFKKILNPILAFTVTAILSVFMITWLTVEIEAHVDPNQPGGTDPNEIFTIADALQEYETTVSLGDAIETPKSNDLDSGTAKMVDDFIAMLLSDYDIDILFGSLMEIKAKLAGNPDLRKRLKQFETTVSQNDGSGDIDLAIVKMIIDFEAMPKDDDTIYLLLQTADDIDAALVKSNEDNPALRAKLSALAKLLREMAKIIIEGDYPIGGGGTDGPPTPIKPGPTVPPSDGGGDGETGDPIEAGKQVIIDGQIYYVDKLEEIILYIHNRIQNDTTLTAEEIAGMNALLNNIKRYIENEK